MNRLRCWIPQLLLLILTVSFCLSAQVQRPPKDAASGYDRAARGTLIHPAIVYVSGNDDAQHVADVLPGHEVVVMERNGAWVRAFTNIDQPEQQSDDQTPEFGNQQTMPQSGWIRNKGLITPTTPNGDAILFGAAANFEDQAAHPHAPQGAAQSAHLLYRRVADYFPDSPLAPEAMYRAADIRWQLDKADISTLPSAKEQEAYLRPQLYEGDFQKLMKLYPNSKFAALAAWDLIDNKLCGDWQGLPKCPELEAVLYEKYADRYPDSPKAPQALYEATYREAVLVDMYKSQDERKRADAAAQATQGLAVELKQRFPQSDYAARAATLAYRVQQQIPVYGNDRD